MYAYTLSFFHHGLFRSDYHVKTDESPISVFVHCLDDGSVLFHHHSLFRDGWLVARQASYQGV